MFVNRGKNMTFLQQLPIVFGALNVGFLQTLKLFGITLVGALPLGLIIAFGSMSRFRPLSIVTRFFVWIIRGTHLLFSQHGSGAADLGQR